MISLQWLCNLRGSRRVYIMLGENGGVSIRDRTYSLKKTVNE